MLVPDILHEFELGVWKAVFTHLIHMLYSINDDLVHELDHRYVCFAIQGQSFIFNLCLILP
jgi:hypothetical protein